MGPELGRGGGEGGFVKSDGEKYNPPGVSGFWRGKVGYDGQTMCREC